VVHEATTPVDSQERAGWKIRMNTVLYFSASGAVYETRAYTKADIAQLVNDRGLVCLTSTNRQFDFWFAPSPGGCQRRVNQTATELLLATTSFTAMSVPLLRGCVVVATHDSEGELDGLSWEQLDLLAARNRSLSKRDARRLDRRIGRDNRRQRRSTAAPAPATVRRTRTRTPVRH
jgi:hypothetical protein